MNVLCKITLITVTILMSAFASGMGTKPPANYIHKKVEVLQDDDQHDVKKGSYTKIIKRAALFVATGAMLIGSQARATVDALIQYKVPYSAIQTRGYCMLDTTMWAELGIPAASAMEAIFSDVLIYRQSSGRPGRHVNINALSGVKGSFISDEYHDTYRYAKFELDMTSVASSNGNTVEGRQKTINLAKLSILALGDTLQGQGSNPYKMDILFKGLPSQQGLAGKKVFASTKFPYSEASPLITTYRKELINLEEECR